MAAFWSSLARVPIVNSSLVFDCCVLVLKVKYGKLNSYMSSSQHSPLRMSQACAHSVSAVELEVGTTRRVGYRVLYESVRGSSLCPASA